MKEDVGGLQNIILSDIMKTGRYIMLILFLITVASADLYITNQTMTGDKVYIFVNDIDENGSLLNGTITVTTPSKQRFNLRLTYGQAEFNATESGEWTVEYNGIVKTVTVKTHDEHTAKTANIKSNPFLVYLIIIILGVTLGGIAVLFTLHNMLKPPFRFKKEFNNETVTLTFENNTGDTIRDVIIEDKVPANVSNISISPEKESKDTIVWRLRKVLPYEEKKITYQAMLDKMYPASASFEYKKKKITLKPVQPAHDENIKINVLGIHTKKEIKRPKKLKRQS